MDLNSFTKLLGYSVHKNKGIFTGYLIKNFNGLSVDDAHEITMETYMKVARAFDCVPLAYPANNYESAYRSIEDMNREYDVVFQYGHLKQYFFKALETTAVDYVKQRRGVCERSVDFSDITAERLIKEIDEFYEEMRMEIEAVLPELCDLVLEVAKSEVFSDDERLIYELFFKGLKTKDMANFIGINYEDELEGQRFRKMVSRAMIKLKFEIVKENTRSGGNLTAVKLPQEVRTRKADKPKKRK